ncbi:RNA ligase 1 family protein [Streptomyces sp. NPDC002690]
MRKIPTLFLRDFASRPAGVLPEVTVGCGWVLAGEGVATRKYDGTCVRTDEAGAWWARREVRPGRDAPPEFVPLSTDPATGKTVGWEPVARSSFAKFHAEALAGGGGQEWPPGTYELIGPRINGNPERSGTHRLVEHATAEQLDVVELTFEGIRARVRALASADGCEGIVWHHPDGRMAKIKARDFPAGPGRRP